MTIDSTYEPEVRERDAEVEYPFTFESIGEEALQVYLINEITGARTLLTRTATEIVQ